MTLATYGADPSSVSAHADSYPVQITVAQPPDTPPNPAGVTKGTAEYLASSNVQT